jgi:hypothetical protein
MGDHACVIIQLLVGFAKFTLAEERVYLYLVHSRDMSRLFDEIAQMSRTEVAHPNRPDAPFRQKLHRGFVGSYRFIKGRRNWPVSQIQIQKIESEPAQTSPTCCSFI